MTKKYYFLCPYSASIQPVVSKNDKLDLNPCKFSFLCRKPLFGLHSTEIFDLLQEWPATGLRMEIVLGWLPGIEN
jgi:hypothetical protein